MHIKDLKNKDAIDYVKEQLSSNVENTKDTLSLLNQLFQCVHIEIFYHDSSQGLFINIEDANQIKTSYLTKKSILGKSFISQKSYVVNNLLEKKRYDIAIDNPYKLTISSQLVLNIIHNNETLGIIRLSDNKPFCTVFLEKIRFFTHSFKDILLNENYKKVTNYDKVFDTEISKIYLALQKIKNLYKVVLVHTEHQEIKKLISQGNANVDSLLDYVNPNIDNVSKIKQNLKQLQNPKDKDALKIRVLIVDDVKINSKILNAMLIDEDIFEIIFAYDGVEAINKALSNKEASKIINIVFLDHHMPRKTGNEVAAFLKKEDKEVIIVSITNDPSAIKELDYLYDYHIAKPFNKAFVIETFHKAKEDLTK